MIEFKVHCLYWGKEKLKLLNDKKPQEYHWFAVVNTEIPNEYLSLPFQEDFCFIWISDHLIKNISGNITKKKDYSFILNLGEEKAANFKHKVVAPNSKTCHNNMILKAKSYWENTVQKIGFWVSENYFYESKEKSEKPTKNPNNSPAKAENKTDWGKIALVCLPIVILAFFSFLIITSWVGKRKKQ